MSSVSSVNGETSMPLGMDCDFSTLLQDERLNLSSEISTSTDRLSFVERDLGSNSDIQNDDMEITEAVSNQIRCKLVSSALLFNECDTNSTQLSLQNNQRISNSSDLSALPIEFTVPLSEALNRPKPPSDIWLALQAITHSGLPTENNESRTTIEQEQESEVEIDMDLTSAIMRLERARTSIICEGETVLDSHSSDNSITDDEESINSVPARSYINHSYINSENEREAFKHIAGIAPSYEQEEQETIFDFSTLSDMQNPSLMIEESITRSDEKNNVCFFPIFYHLYNHIC